MMIKSKSDTSIEKNSTSSQRSRHIPSLLSIIFGIVAVLALTISTVEVSPPYVVGENLILTEIHILPNFYLKPMTLFTYAFFLSFAFGLYTPITKQRVKSLPEGLIRIFYIIAGFMAMASGFEVVYHIVLWSAALGVQGLQNPDIITNPWPQNRYPINVVFSAKLVVLIFAISLFVIDYLNRVEKEKLNENKF